MDHFKALKNNFHIIHDFFLPKMLATEESLFRQPQIQEINPIAWISWHILRAEDMYLNTVIFSQQQVFESNDWKSKLNINTSNIGTGMPKEEALKLSLEVDITGLEVYNQAVKDRALELMDRSHELADDVFDTPENIEQRLLQADAFPEGVTQSRAKAYAAGPLSGGFTGISMHAFMHIGQYMSITKPL